MKKFNYKEYISKNKFAIGKVVSKHFENSIISLNEEARITDDFTSTRHYEPKVGDEIAYNIASNIPTKFKGAVKHNDGLGFFVSNKGKKLEVQKLMNIKVTKVA